MKDHVPSCGSARLDDDRRAEGLARPDQGIGRGAATSKRSVHGAIATLATGALAAAIAGLPVDAAAADPAPAATSARADDAAPGGWRIDVTSYGWMSGFRGTTATLPPLPAVHVDLGFGDILSKLDGAVMGIVYARKDRMILWGDLMYSKLSVEQTFVTSVSTSLKLSSSTLIASGGVGWTLVDDRTWSLDLLAGARFYDVVTDATLSIPGIGVTRSGRTDETWVDPMIGARFGARLSERWYLTSWAFVGGFDAGSRSSWDLFGGLGYDVSDRYTLLVGYRGLGVDYARGGYVYDVVQQGPIVGLKVRF